MRHGHGFRRAEWHGVRFYETDNSSGASEPVYHLVRCEPASRRCEVANESEIVYEE